MKPLLLLLALASCSAIDPSGRALAQPCGILGATPQSIGGCTVNGPYGRPAVRITEPYPGTGYRATPVPGNGIPRIQSAPVFRPYGGYIGAPPVYPR